MPNSNNVVTELEEAKELSEIDTSRLEDKLGFKVRMAERAMHKAFIQAVGMTPVQYSIFTLVADNEGSSQGTIGEALNLDRASTMAIMDKLEIAGLVERRKSPVDRRRHALYLTAKGKQEVGRIEKAVKQSDEVFRSQLSERQLKDFLRYVEYIRHA